MTSDPELSRIVRSWLDDGATVIPDRVVESVMAELPATRQRRRWLPAWRDLSMNTSVRLAAAVAVVSILVVGGIGLTRPDLSGGPGPSPSPASTPGASPSGLLPMAPAGWCNYVRHLDFIGTPGGAHLAALEKANTGDLGDWKRLGPELFTAARAARLELEALIDRPEVADVSRAEAALLDGWIGALEASFEDDAGSAEIDRVYDTYNAWQANRFAFVTAMTEKFETACP